MIAVTGSSGKTTTTSLLGSILSKHGPSGVHFGHNGRSAVSKALRRIGPNDKFTVMETGVGRPGDMAATVDLMRPDVAVITLVALEHRFTFRTVEAVALEKGGLVEAVNPGGFAVLNADDPAVMEMAARTSERIVTFGREQDADYRVTDVKTGFPDPMRVTIEHAGQRVELETQLIADHFWVTIAAAYAVASELGVPLDKIKGAIAEFKAKPVRCQTLIVPGGPAFIVDTAKAPWASLEKAVETFASAKGPRKRFVLGQLSDFSGKSSLRYRQAYDMIYPHADQVLFCGAFHSSNRATVDDIQKERFIGFEDTKALADYIRETAIDGEVIMLKSASNLHLERIALAFTEDVQCWVPKCGLKTDCYACGLYRHPFDQHSAKLKRQVNAARTGLDAWSVD